MNSNLLRITTEVLQAVRDYTGNNDIQSQTVLVFLHVALRREVAMSELQKLVGISQASVSRNVAKHSIGLSVHEKGQNLVEAFEDPAYRVRKLVRISEKGLKLVKIIEEKAGRFLVAPPT
jgi:DNA-binding MarR family transcriptional regulator